MKHVRNQVLSFRQARQINDQLIAQRMEQNSWFTYNLQRLNSARLAGRLIEPAARNVAERLIRIAKHQAEVA